MVFIGIRYAQFLPPFVFLDLVVEIYLYIEYRPQEEYKAAEQYCIEGHLMILLGAFTYILRLLYAFPIPKATGILPLKRPLPA